MIFYVNCEIVVYDVFQVKKLREPNVQSPDGVKSETEGSLKWNTYSKRSIRIFQPHPLRK